MAVAVSDSPYTQAEVDFNAAAANVLQWTKKRSGIGRDFGKSDNLLVRRD